MNLLEEECMKALSTYQAYDIMRMVIEITILVLKVGT
jgi:hypothetical protein